MADSDVRMAQEIREAPAAVERQADELRGPIVELVAALRR